MILGIFTIFYIFFYFFEDKMSTSRLMARIKKSILYRKTNPLSIVCFVVLFLTIPWQPFFMVRKIKQTLICMKNRLHASLHIYFNNCYYINTSCYITILAINGKYDNAAKMLAAHFVKSLITFVFDFQISTES